MTLAVVTGVGTDVGKTHAATALLRAWSAYDAVVGYKPIETGVTQGRGADEQALASVSTFHVKHPLVHFRFRAAVSPHLAARMEGQPIDLQEIARAVASLRDETVVVVELAGGLFSPLSDTETNADLVAMLSPEITVLVAPDRLGVLHEVRALQEACRGRRLAVDGVVLSAPATPDASTGTNAAEIARTMGMRVLATLFRAPVDDLVASGALEDLVSACRSRSVLKTATLE